MSEDRLNQVKELIVSTRDPAVTGALTASEDFANHAGAGAHSITTIIVVTYARLYFLIPSTGSGVSGTNYNETDYGYTAALLLLNRTKTPGGTIARVVYHAQGWPLERWTGTDDTGATDTTPGGSSPNNMVKIEAYEYDSNAAGGNVL